MRRLLLLLALSALLALPVSAGTLPVAWSPVTASDLAGYRLFWGTTAGSYTGQVDVGKVTTATLVGLPDCQTVYVAVKAIDAAGNLSASYSNEISGWASVAIDAAPPRVFEVGTNYGVVITGSNFKPGAKIYLDFGASHIEATGVTQTGCTQIAGTIPTTASTPIGAWALTVENGDATWRQLQNFASTVANAPPPTVTGVKRTDQKSQ